jgi:uncharacterized protein (DUF1697 family)
MQELRDILEALGLSEVRSYIQSGNVVFGAELEDRTLLAASIESRIEAARGFRPRVYLLSAEDLRAAMTANPFPEAELEPKTLHFFFLAEPAQEPDIQALEDMRKPGEAFRLTEQVFYLHAPEGIGRSKLATNVDRRLGVATTARNFRSVEKLRAMADEVEKS